MKIFLVAVALFVCLGLIWWGVQDPVGIDGAEYMTAPIERGRLHRTVTATGTVNAVMSVDVGSQLSGQIIDVLVDFNDQVQAGQEVARLDQKGYLAEVNQANATLEVANANAKIAEAGVERAGSALASALAKVRVMEASVLRARATLTEAKGALKRSRRLLGTGVVTEEKQEQAQAGYDRASADLLAATAEQGVHEQVIAMARADLRIAEAELLDAEARIPEKAALLELAKVDLERTVIRSPIDGVIIAREIDEGQTVAASLEAPKLFSVAGDLRFMEVHVNVDEADIGQIRNGQRATFGVDAFPGLSFEGRVEQVRKSPDLIQNVVTYKVVVATKNPDLLLLPGMTALVQLVVMESEETLKIPAAALRFAPKGLAAEEPPPTQTGGEGSPAMVWVLDTRGRPSARWVRIGMSDTNSGQMLDGPFKADDEVIVNEIPVKGENRLFGIRIGF